MVQQAPVALRPDQQEGGQNRDKGDQAPDRLAQQPDGQLDRPAGDDQQRAHGGEIEGGPGHLGGERHGHQRNQQQQRRAAPEGDPPAVRATRANFARHRSISRVSRG